MTVHLASNPQASTPASGAAPGPASLADARLVLSEPELDAALELLLLAEASVWSAADAALEGVNRDGVRLGRGHWRAAFLIRRRPGLGVQALADLIGLSKQGASRTLCDLEQAGMVEKGLEEDARRRPAALTDAGRTFESRVSERLRGVLARAYRTGGIESAPAARRIWTALAGARASTPVARHAP